MYAIFVHLIFSFYPELKGYIPQVRRRSRGSQSVYPTAEEMNEISQKSLTAGSLSFVMLRFLRPSRAELDFVHYITDIDICFSSF